MIFFIVVCGLNPFFLSHNGKGLVLVVDVTVVLVSDMFVRWQIAEAFQIVCDILLHVEAMLEYLV